MSSQEPSSSEPSSLSSEQITSSEAPSSSSEPVSSATSDIPASSLSSDVPSSSSSAAAMHTVEVKEGDGKLPSRYRTWYQLLVYSFADSDGNGIGDFQGIVNHLDYLQNLGVGGLWLSPIHPASSYHAYNVTDYYAVNSLYGDMNAFNHLVDECHKRDIKVILDLVINHSSNQHPWFSQHGDWYNSDRTFGNDFPEFNYDNQAVRSQMKDVGQYWLNKGVDGFRFDAALWIYNNFKNKSELEKSISWWQEYGAYLRSVKNDVYLIGEVLDEDNALVKDFYRSKLDADFNFERIGYTVNASKGSNAASWASYVASYQKDIRTLNPDYAIEAPVLSNHDIGRFNVDKNITDVRAIKLANALNVIAPGGAYIYYGDELGLVGQSEGWADMSYRTPMPFASGKTNSQNYMEGRYSTSTTLSGKTADNDAKNASSIYSYISKVANLKKLHEDLFTGKASAVSSGKNSLGALSIDGAKQDYLLLVNSASANQEVTVNCPYTVIGDFATAGSIARDGDTLTIPGKSLAVLVYEGTPSLTLGQSSSESSVSSSEEGFVIDGQKDSKGSRVENRVDGKMTVHYFNGETEWSSVNCYAWDNDGASLGGWPGSPMSEDGYWYTIEIPRGASNVIFNNGSSQTIDLARNEAGEYWFVPTSFSGKIDGDWYRSNPLKG